jgi:tripartite-type tricarboxylate transporter receptor subunit TctC
MRKTQILIALLACLVAAPAALAQDSFPSRPIRLVIPYPAGGTTDIMARALQQPMQDILGKPLVVENKPGAAAVIGTREVAMAQPDGYNLVFVNNGVDIAPYLQKDAGFDPLKSFTPI